MIRAEAFVDALRDAGFRLFSGTPCSYLTPLINRVIDSAGAYVGAANEGDAVAIAAGAELGGRPGVVLFQNSGLGNAVNPLTSLTYTFRIPVLVLVTWRAEPGGPADEPQHELMGRITPDLLRVMGIPFEVVPSAEADLGPLLARAAESMRSTRLPFALILRHGTVGPYALQTRPAPGRPFRLTDLPAGDGPAEPLRADDVLAAIQAGVGPADAVLATTGYTGRALYGLADRPNQFYMVGSMGCASSLGLGLARARPDRRVVVIDGDGAVLMRMGALATVGHERPANLVHILLDNGVHDSTGAQATVSHAVDLAGVAAACGYPRVRRVAALDDLGAELRTGPRSLTFLHVRTRPREDTRLPRPSVTPAAVATRFREWLAGGPSSG
jgi:phosphonopyruvate decarboxylase